MTQTEIPQTEMPQTEMTVIAPEDPLGLTGPEADRSRRLKALSTVIGQLRRMADGFGIRVEDWASLTALYCTGLDDLPPELLQLLLKRVLVQWTNGFRLPLPAELRALIAPELAAHTAALLHQRRAEQQARRTTGAGGGSGISASASGGRFRPETRAEIAARHQARAEAMGWTG